MLVFTIDVDGYHELMQALCSRKALHLQTLLGVEQQNGRFAHGYSLPNALSILPSTTVAAWSSIFTGKLPAQIGVPGNKGFVREQRQFFAPAPVSISYMEDFSKTLNTYPIFDELPHGPIYLEGDQKE